VRSVDFDGELLRIRFTAAGPEFSDLLAVVKSLPGREWLAGPRIWVAPPIPKTVRTLQSHSFEFTPAVESLLSPTPAAPVQETDSPALTEHSAAVSGFRPYQTQALRFLERRRGVGGIFDQMGLGKTIEAIGYFLIHPDARPVVVVCPASVKLKWAREIQKWTDGERVEILYGRSPGRIPEAEWYVINYDILATPTGETDKHDRDILSGWAYELAAVAPAGVIGDEVQYVSNPRAHRTRGFTHLAAHRRRDGAFIPLSGTPIRNRPKEFFTILNLLAPHTFRNRWQYYHRYCDPKHNGFGWSFQGGTNLEELHELISPLMIRRLKSEVLTELPPKQKVVVPMELSGPERGEYQEEEQRMSEWLGSVEHPADPEADAHIERLKQAAWRAKRSSVMDWIADFLESGEKLLVAAWHRKTVEDIQEHFQTSAGAVRIYGGTPAADRQAAVDRFQTDPGTRLLVCHPDSVIGQDLYAAHAGAVVEFPATPSDCEQFEDRLHRIGQTDSVMIYYLVADGTVETHIMDFLEEKHEVVAEVLDGGTRGELFAGGREQLAQKLLAVYRGKAG